MRKLKLPDRDPSKPKLKERDVRLVKELGVQNLEDLAEEVVSERLKNPRKEAKVPYAGNPLYKAMHACNTYSRAKLAMSHKIPSDQELTESEIKSVANLLTRWIVRELNFYREEKKVKQRGLKEF